MTILIAPITYSVSVGVLDPVVHVTDGVANIAANASAGQLTNGLHLASLVLGSFVLPISIIGIARLVMQRSPWLATIGGGLGLLGWLPFSALVAQEDLTLQMARLGGGTDLLGALWGRFNNDATMTVFLVVYIVGHLAAYVVLAIGLWRARVIGAWAAWTLGSTTPLMLAFFATRQRSETLGLVFEIAFMLALVIGSVPVAYVALTESSETSRMRQSHGFRRLAAWELGANAIRAMSRPDSREGEKTMRPTMTGLIVWSDGRRWTKATEPD
ncbi:MAG: hypothetical protein JOZ87_21885 [Chloroflexi bacterium]|nr:hypothetical protein [Chloroflexota bacterium]